MLKNCSIVNSTVPKILPFTEIKKYLTTLSVILTALNIIVL